MADRSATPRRDGARPFVTRRAYADAEGRTRIWDSRRHRKGLSLAGARWHGLWTARDLNLWIGLGFSIGAALFLGPAVATLLAGPEAASAAFRATANRVYFAGSIFFTLAALLQQHQAAIAGLPFDPANRPRLIGWRPGDAGWLSCALQFVGTLLFNVTTYDAMLSGLDLVQTDVAVWGPDLMGSMLFLASGYIAYIEDGHSHRSWRPRSLSWWIVAINLLGCVAFMVSAVFGYAPGPQAAFNPAPLSVGATAVGALCFLIGALLLFPESAGAEATS
jgi:hypothetical protein